MKKILMLVETPYEDLELWYPTLRLEEAGYQVIIAGLKKGETYFGKYGYPCTSHIAFDQVKEEEFKALVIPGGFAPDKLRRYKVVLELVKKFHTAKKPIAFICHGAWVPISAKILANRKATSTPAICDDMENAGVIWSDEPLVVDDHLISSQKPADLPLFAKAILAALVE